MRGSVRSYTRCKFQRFDTTFSMGGSSSYPACNFSEPTEKSVKPCTVRKSRSRKLGEKRSICLADSVWYWQNSSTRVNTRTGLRVSKDQGIAGIKGKRGWAGRRQREKGVWRDGAIGRMGGLLRGKEFDVIALSFPREFGSTGGRIDDSGYERLRVFFPGFSRRGGKTRISSRKIEGIRGDLLGIAHVKETSISVSC